MCIGELFLFNFFHIFSFIYPFFMLKLMPFLFRFSFRKYRLKNFQYIYSVSIKSNFLCYSFKFLSLNEVVRVFEKKKLEHLSCRYLAEVLYSWQITTLNRAESHLQREEVLTEKNNSKSRNNKKTKKNKKKIRVHTKELAMCQVNYFFFHLTFFIIVFNQTTTLISFFLFFFLRGGDLSCNFFLI